MHQEYELLLDEMDINDPILLIWALDSILNVALLDPLRAEALNKKLMEKVDLPLTVPLLHAVEARQLLSRVPLGYWKGQEEQLITFSTLNGGDCLDVVAKHLLGLDEARGLSFIKETLDSDGVKANVMVKFKLLKLLHSLESSAAEAFCYDIVDSWEDDPQFFSRDQMTQKSPGWMCFYRLAWRGNHGVVEEIARACLLEANHEDFFSYMEHGESLLLQGDLFSSTLLALKVIFKNGNEFGLSEVWRFFNQSRLFEEVTALFNQQVEGEPIDLGLRGLFIKYGDRIACHRLRRLLATLLVDDAFKEEMTQQRLEDPDASYWESFQLFVLAALLTADRKEDGDFDALDEWGISELLTHVLLTDKDRGRVIEGLESCDRGMVVSVICVALERAKEHSDPRNTLLVMRSLGYPEWLPQLVEMFDEDFERVHTIAMEAIVRTGDEGSAFVRDSFATCAHDKYFKSSLIETVRKMPRPAMVAFLERHFEEALRVNREMTLNLCAKAAWEGALPWLLPRFGKRQIQIDEVCLALAGIHGLDLDAGDVVALGHRSKVADQNRRFGDIFSGKAFDAQDSLELELRCEACGEEAFYDVDRVFSGQDGKHFIGVELQCIGCGEQAFFSPTKRGVFGLNAELMRVIEKHEREGGPSKSVIDISRGFSFGKPMGIVKAVETYRARLTKDPLNAELHLGFGNLLKFCRHYKKSIKHYARCIELQPAMLQAHLGAAQVKEVLGDDNAAFAWLKKGVPYLKRPVFKKDPNFDLSTVLFAYCEMHNTILKRLDLDAEVVFPPLQPEATTVHRGKIGRNAPCPCGSGKKYKKCCAMKKR